VMVCDVLKSDGVNVRTMGTPGPAPRFRPVGGVIVTSTLSSGCDPSLHV
jgi:hypothetical protein